MRWVYDGVKRKLALGYLYRTQRVCQEEQNNEGYYKGTRDCSQSNKQRRETKKNNKRSCTFLNALRMQTERSILAAFDKRKKKK